MAETILLSSMVTVSQSQVSCELEGETVILGVDAGTYYGLNPVGCRIWSLIQSPRSVSDLCRALINEYEVDPMCCEREVLDLLAQLASERLIDVRHAEAS